MKSSKVMVAQSAKDLAGILDLSDADAAWIELRGRLLARIVQEVIRRRMTHQALARAANMSRTRVTGILNGNLQSVSTDLLLRIASVLGLQPDIRLRRAA